MKGQREVDRRDWLWMVGKPRGFLIKPRSLSTDRRVEKREGRRGAWTQSRQGAELSEVSGGRKFLDLQLFLLDVWLRCALGNKQAAICGGGVGEQGELCCGHVAFSHRRLDSEILTRDTCEAWATSCFLVPR